MNTIVEQDRHMKYIGFWRSSKEINKNDVDSKGVVYPYPSDGKPWKDQQKFLYKLVQVEAHLIKKGKKIPYPKFKYGDCLLCDAKNISTGVFRFGSYIWDSYYKHYVKKHNIYPPYIFREFISRSYTPIKSVDNKKPLTTFRVAFYQKKNIKYIKLTRNQLNILDALMKHGSYEKRYTDLSNNKLFKYSEHAGLLDFNNSGLEKILVSGNTTRTDVHDDDIFFPKNFIEAYDFEYIFHTHPATPKPGGRAEFGIIYELPSIGDIFHFLEHYNKGMTQGSIVVAPEGLYIIRKKNMDSKKINISEDDLFEDIKKRMNLVQREAIKKYGYKFNTNIFYSKISQDKSHIDKVNKILEKYLLYIDYYPRKKDYSGKWVLDSIYLPVQIVEPEKI
jgi:hypothetical protein